MENVFINKVRVRMFDRLLIDSRFCLIMHVNRLKCFCNFSITLYEKNLFEIWKYVIDGINNEGVRGIESIYCLESDQFLPLFCFNRLLKFYKSFIFYTSLSDPFILLMYTVVIYIFLLSFENMYQHSIYRCNIDIYRL